MRWPFGPPHLTLKPSQKTKTKKIKINTKKQEQKKEKNTKKTKTKAKQEPTPKTIQQQNKNKANKTETKATQKAKTNTRNTKTPKPSKPKIKKNKPPHKSPKNWEKKQAFFNTSGTMPNTPKTNHNNIKTSKKQTQKTPFCHVQKQPTIFPKLSVFSTYNFVFKKLCFAENTIKIMFSEKHTFSKTQLVKPTFSPMSKTPFSKKRCHFCFWAFFRWNHYFYSFSWFTLFWSKKIWPKQIVCTKMRVFLPSWHK